MGRYFEDRLRQMEFRSDATIRVKGLAIGIELEKKGYADRILEKSRKAGLLVTGEEDTLTLFPALTIDRAAAAEGLDILDACI